MHMSRRRPLSYRQSCGQTQRMTFRDRPPSNQASHAVEPECQGNSGTADSTRIESCQSTLGITVLLTVLHDIALLFKVLRNGVPKLSPQIPSKVGHKLGVDIHVHSLGGNVAGFSV